MSAGTDVAVINPASDADERRKGIGGSDVAVLLGLSPYKTPLDLYLQKRGVWEDEHESEAAHWGTVMEPVLAREYVRRYGIRLVRKDLEFPFLYSPSGDDVDADPWRTGPGTSLLGTLVHPQYPWARGHVDGIGLSAAGEVSHVCEFKTADSRLAGFWGDEDTDQIPEAYLCQVQWYLMLAELEVAHVAALIGGNRFRRYIVPRDETLIEIMLERSAIFWEMVLRGDPPAPAPGERGQQSLARMYPAGTAGKELDATPTLMNLARELHQLRRYADEAKEAKTTAENDIKLIMADATRLNLGPKTYIGWANNRDSKVTDWEAVTRHLVGRFGLHVSEIETLIAQFTTTKPGARVFRCQGFDKLFDEREV